MRLFGFALFIPFAFTAHSNGAPRASDPSRVEANDNTSRAGTLADGVLTVKLEARIGEMKPEGPHNPSLTVYAFGEEGKPLQAPGPQIRVMAGTKVHVTLRNSLPKPMLVRGLNARPGLDSADLAPGETRDFTFTPVHPGTYYYWGRTEGRRTNIGFWNDSQLIGALIVDSAPPRPGERVMVITNWGDLSDTTRPPATVREHLFVNGLSWPYTERLSYTVGDSVFWRVINTTIAPHPMHLHGFYYSVLSRGAAASDTIYTKEQRRTVVTESMAARTTMSMAFSPDRPGNWLFHCHLILHITTDQRLGDVATTRADFTHGMHSHSLEGMAGLVMGLHVNPGKSASPDLVQRVSPKKLHLFVNQRPYVYGSNPGYSFILQDGSKIPAADSLRIPGSPIILTRGVPYEITVTNRTPEMVSVHWHGIELQSYYDGVGDWSGSAGKTAPPIMPGKSFVVKFTPDRAGTFIYHTHSDEDRQLSSGLYGPLIILEPGARFDADLDRVVLLAAGGPADYATPLFNGSTNPAPLEMKAGKTYRLRIINITPSDSKQVRILADTVVQQWRAFAKDGATLPAHQAVVKPAVVFMNPGETYDYEFTPSKAGTLGLEVLTVRRLPAPVKTIIPVKVSE